MTEADRPSGQTTGAVTVLLVDDDETWAASTARILEGQRDAFSVATATCVTAATERFAALDPDCVVADYQLEGETGLDLLEMVRERAPDRPFILITGQGSESVASDAIGQRVTDYIPKRALGGRDDRLARRIESAVESYRTRRALDRERRSKDAMLDILTDTTDRAELSRRFCERLVDAGGFACAWVGTDDGADGLTSRSVAGRSGYLDAVLGGQSTPPSGEPAARALARDEPVTAVVEVDGGQANGPEGRDGPADVPPDWEAVAADHGFESVLAVPISHDGVRFGVLAVYAGDGTLTTDRERSAVVEYADTVGYALREAERKRSLLSSRRVALDVRIDDPTVPVVRLADAVADAERVTVRSVLPREDETTLYVVDVQGADAADVADSADATDAVADAEVESLSGGVRCAVVVDERTPEAVLADCGAQFRRTVVADGVATVSVQVTDDGTVGRIREAVTAEYDAAAVSTIWTGRTGSARDGDPLAALTDRQREILRHAYDVGYFERPRGASATDLADHFGIARATLTQHLRAAERKVLDDAFADPDATE